MEGLAVEQFIKKKKTSSTIPAKGSAVSEKI